MQGFRAFLALRLHDQVEAILCFRRENSSCDSSQFGWCLLRSLEIRCHLISNQKLYLTRNLSIKMRYYSATGTGLFGLARSVWPFQS